MSRLTANEPSNASWQLDLSGGHNKVGAVRLAQGDLVGALVAFQASMDVRTALAAGDPSNAGLQRDLAFSLFRMATVHEQQRQFWVVRDFAKQCAEIFERLAALDRTNATWQNDVDVSREMVVRLTAAGG